MTGAVTVDNGKSLTIDLNGHTLTAPENSKAFWIRGGALTIEWDEKTNHIFMTGPAEFVFDGELEYEG